MNEARKDILSYIRLIACGVFKPALDNLEIKKRYPHVGVTFLPSNLHVRPGQLEKSLFREIAAAQRRHEKVVCLYGDCFPDIDHFCRRHGVLKLRALYCYETFLGSERFRRILEEAAGTYFLERDLILNFEEYCVEPLELHDEEVRKCYFEHYQKLLYVRQPSDPDLVPRAIELARFLELPLEIRDADYSHLNKELHTLIECDSR
jgi:hypothetical protein